MKHANIKTISLYALVFAASGVLLTLIQPPFELDWLAWIALVPFILICSANTKPTQLAIAAYVVGFCYWLGNLYWIGYVTAPGWIAFCLYIGLYWPVLAISVRFCRKKNLSLFWIVPLLFVGAETFQGHLLLDFSWRLLAHSQYKNITLIQIADIFGAAGVSLLIAMVNGLLGDLIIAIKRKKIFAGSNFIKAAIAVALIAGTIFYGQYRLTQAEKFTHPGPIVASVQSNVPLEVKESGQAAEQIFADLLKSSIAATAAGAELVVWPETMVQAILDERFLLLCSSSHRSNIFDSMLSQHAKNNAYILIGAHGGRPEVKNNTIKMVEKYNSAFLYRPDGRQDSKRYDKIHLVPFGEFVPFKKSFPLLHKLLMKLTPYDYDYTLDRGKEYSTFEMKSQTATYKFGVMICYEDTVSAIARKMTINDQAEKKIDWLLNISNDGWFVRFKNARTTASTELAQHMVTCVFRAIENRLPIMRSVNTGISCLVDSNGRIRDDYLAGNLPRRAMLRQGVAGWFTDKIPIDSRKTFFSRFGQWLDICCGVGFAVILLLQIFRKFFTG